MIEAYLPTRHYGPYKRIYRVKMLLFESCSSESGSSTVNRFNFRAEAATRNPFDKSGLFCGKLTAQKSGKKAEKPTNLLRQHKSKKWYI